MCGTAGTRPTRSRTCAASAIRGNTRPRTRGRTGRGRFTASSLSSRLAPYTGGIGRIKRFTDVRRGVSGRIVRAMVRGTGGSASVEGDELRRALGLPDGRVWINTNRTIVGAVRAKYDALMCRPGLPRSPVVTLDHGSRQLFATRRDLPQRPGRPHDLAEGSDPDRVRGGRRRARPPGTARLQRGVGAADLRGDRLLRLPPDHPRVRADLLQAGRRGACALGTGAVGLSGPRRATERARIPEDAGARGERSPAGVLRARHDRVRERQLRRQRRLRFNTGRARSRVRLPCTRTR